MTQLVMTRVERDRWIEFRLATNDGLVERTVVDRNGEAVVVSYLARFDDRPRMLKDVIMSAKHTLEERGLVVDEILLRGM